MIGLNLPAGAVMAQPSNHIGMAWIAGMGVEKGTWT